MQPFVTTLIGFLVTFIVSPIFAGIPLCCLSQKGFSFRGYYLRGMALATLLYAAFFLACAPVYQSRCNDIGTSYSFLNDHPGITPDDVYAACKAYLWVGVAVGSLFLIVSILVFVRSRHLLSCEEDAKYRGVEGGMPAMAPLNNSYVPLNNYGASPAETRPFNQPVPYQQ
ncbi:hypothetical protein HDU79_002969 [Rhizoclosmatium sp. JEL0117]|nr:hypothetical protein HDU79_002969 [Rhizoclosmatium sp. JEL0117]